VPAPQDSQGNSRAKGKTHRAISAPLGKLDVTDSKVVIDVARVERRLSGDRFLRYQFRRPPSNWFKDIPPEASAALGQLLMVTTTYFAREALPAMQENKWARLITIVSPAAKQPADDGLARSLR
jgi:hypothetical protein